MRARSIHPVLPALVPLLLAACSSDGSSGPPEIDEVQVTTVAGAADIEVQRGATVQLRARALRNGSEVAGIQFQWRSEAPSIASVDTAGLVEGLDYGEAEIVAELVGAVGPAGRATARVLGPPVASITFGADSTWLDTGDTLTLRAFPRDGSGAQLTGVELTWSSTSPNLSVNTTTGRLQGLSPGQAEVEARAWNDVTGTARVRVTPVTGLAPDSGRYGAVMTIEGAGLPAGISRVEFTGAGGSRVPAFVRSASQTAVEVWVPAESQTGPIRLVGAADSFPTSRPFDITANDDIFEGGDCGGLDCIYLVPVPYHNPSLVAAFSDRDNIGFELENPSPISIYLVDRGELNGDLIGAFVVRNDPFGVAGQLIAADFLQGVYLDSVVYSHPSLPPGVYFLQILGLSTQQAEIRRAYGLTITTTAVFQIAPDALEPNDTPIEAAPAPITLPFDRADLVLENPYSVDNYVFTVGQPSAIAATLTAGAGDADLVLIRGDSVDLFVAEPSDIVAAGSTIDTSNESLQATVDPGTYTMSVVEFGGQATTYRLEITATPTSAVGPFTLSAPLPPVSGARRFPFLAPVHPDRIVRVRAR